MFLVKRANKDILIFSVYFYFLIEPSNPVRPTITSIQRTIHAINGDTANLVCISHGFPDPMYYWYKQRIPATATVSSLSSSSSSGQQLTNNLMHIHTDSYRTYILAGTGILIIKNVSQSDTGRYTCLANNTVGEDQLTIELIVKQPLSVSIRTLPVLADRIEVSSEISLFCDITGYPLESIVWSKDGKPLNLTGYRRKLVSPKIVNILKVERSDQGCYKCTAYSGSDKTNNNNHHDFNDDHASDQVCLRLAQDPPTFKETFHELIRNQGDSLSLKCVAIGNPLPTVTWTLDGNPIPETHRIQYGDYVR